MGTCSESSTTYNITGDLMTIKYEAQSCCQCGVDFCLTLQYVTNKKRTKGSFNCPNGHQLIFTNPDKKTPEETEPPQVIENPLTINYLKGM